MSTARKFKPGWDHAFFLERTQVERERRPRLQPTKIKLPKRVAFDPAKIQALWREIMGVNVSRQHIIENWNAIHRWYRSLKKSRGRNS